MQHNILRNHSLLMSKILLLHTRVYSTVTVTVCDALCVYSKRGYYHTLMHSVQESVTISASLCKY